MKAAKLEIKMIVAMFVVGYEYDVVDSEGRISDRLPVPNYNEQQQVCFTVSHLEIGKVTEHVCFFPLYTRRGRRASHISSSSSVWSARNIQLGTLLDSVPPSPPTANHRLSDPARLQYENIE